MEQRDYLLREIEKIGMVIRAIRQKLFGGTDELAVSVETQAETLKEMLLSEAYLDIDVLVALNPAETEKYLASLKGFNTENIELLAKTLTELSINGDSADSRTMLEKALQLYEICNLRDRTFSFEREAAVNQIQEVLQK
ncbi:MAG: hypothetical protein ACM3NP_05375 [Actinomycetota bacterium]